jgi:hypothetical protein
MIFKAQILSRTTPLVALLFLAVLCLSCQIDSANTPFLQPQTNEKFFISAQFSGSSVDFSENMSVGSGSVSFEPDKPASLAGFGGIHRRLLPPFLAAHHGYFTYFAPYTKVDLPPKAKTLLWHSKDAQGTPKVALVITLDLVAVTADMTQKLLTIVQKKFPTWKLSQENFQILASHSHASIGGLSESALWGLFASERYSPELFAFVSEKIVESIVLAEKNLRAFQNVKTSEYELPQFNKSRLTGMNVQARTLTTRFHNQTSEIGQGCLQIYSVHPTFFGQKQLTLSSDVVGHIEQEWSQQSASGCYFWNGSVGNAEAALYGEAPEYAKNFVAAALLEEKNAKVHSAQNLRFGAYLIGLPKPTVNATACGLGLLKPFLSVPVLRELPLQTKVSYMAIGDLLLLFFPGEPVFDVQQQFEKEILNHLPQFKAVQLLSTANDYLGYVVSSDSYNQISLESCSSLYGKNFANDFLQSIMPLLKEDLKNYTASTATLP